MIKEPRAVHPIAYSSHFGWRDSGLDLVRMWTATYADAKWDHWDCDQRRPFPNYGSALQ